MRSRPLLVRTWVQPLLVVVVSVATVAGCGTTSSPTTSDRIDSGLVSTTTTPIEPTTSAVPVSTMDCLTQAPTRAADDDDQHVLVSSTAPAVSRLNYLRFVEGHGFVALHDGGQFVFESVDGLEWDRTPTVGLPGTGKIIQVHQRAGTWIAVHQGALIDEGNPISIATSTDRSTWTTVSLPGVTLRDLTSETSTIVISGDRTLITLDSRSEARERWTTIVISGPIGGPYEVVRLDRRLAITDVVEVGGRHLALAAPLGTETSTPTYLSDDLRSWADGPSVTGRVHTLRAVNGTLLATRRGERGLDATQIVRRSLDMGATWTTHTVPITTPANSSTLDATPDVAVLVVQGSSIDALNPRWVADADGCWREAPGRIGVEIFVSDDGATWTRHSADHAGLWPMRVAAVGDDALLLHGGTAEEWIRIELP